VPQDQVVCRPKGISRQPSMARMAIPNRSFPFIGQSIFKSIGSSAVLDTCENALRDQPMQALGQNVGGDAKFRLQIIEPTKLEKSSSQDPEAPTITDHF
jgi:hypothetical protein